MLLPQQYAATQFALVAVNTDCALSFIKPVRRVFNLKLLLLGDTGEGGREEAGGIVGKNVGVAFAKIHRN